MLTLFKAFTPQFSMCNLSILYLGIEELLWQSIALKPCLVRKVRMEWNQELNPEWLGIYNLNPELNCLMKIEIN